MERKLAAILSADVQGYSRLMGDDEEATVQRLTAYREVMVALIRQHRGRVVDAPGDNLLADFASVVDAVQCGVAIQRELTVRNAALPDHRKMWFRIGINLGDVLVEGERIYGDGVNIAARVEGLAEGGGLCLSGTAYDQVENKLNLEYVYLGEQVVKNIAKPVRVYRVVLEAEPRDAAQAAPESVQAGRRTGMQVSSARGSAFAARRRRTRHFIRAGMAVLVLLALAGAFTWRAARSKRPVGDPVVTVPRGPSIAVLPFANLSGDQGQEYFADGMTEEIITQLTRFRELFVIARNSTFRYKAQAVDMKTIGRELGMRYVLEGSIRTSPDTIRVTAQLIDAMTGTHLWAETYDRQLTARNILDVQHEITEQIVAKIAEPFGVISRVGVTETQRKGTDNLTAYECVVRVRLQHDSPSSPALHLQQRDCLERAVALDANYAEAWAWLALTYMHEYVFGFNPKPEPLDRVLKAARRAVALDPASAITHYSLAYAYFFRHELEPFTAAAEQAFELNPNNALILGSLGNLFGWIGQLDRSMALTKKAMVLNPHHPTFFYATIFNYHYHRREYKDALAAAQKWNQPDFFWNQAHLAEAYAQLGRTKEAQAAVARLLKLYPDFPQRARAEMRIWNVTDEIAEHWLDGLRKAGLEMPPDVN
jgi:adenylate cyclase